MNSPAELRSQRVGALRPNQLLHTYDVGAVADLPNLSVVMLGLDHWDLNRSAAITEERLLRAVRAKLGQQVQTLRLPPHLPETSDPFAEWARVGVPVAVFPTWLRCSDTRCNRLGRVDAGFFELLPHSYLPHLVRYVHPCRGQGGRRPTAVPARFVLACDNGHLDDFPWSYFVHRGGDPGAGHSLKLTERGSTGEAINIFVTCDQCGIPRPMSDAIGVQDELDLLTPEWEAFTAEARTLPDFTTRLEPVPSRHRDWLDRVVLVPRLREVAALYGFTRIDAPEWDVVDTPDRRRGPLATAEPTWVPCAEMRGEGIFLRFHEERLVAWEHQPEVKQREQPLIRAHESWRAQRQLPPGRWPGLRYLLLHTFAHALIRELALECGYSAAGIGERIYSRPGTPMAGVLLYTAAPDSEGTLGGLVSLGRTDRLGPLIDQALAAARLCSSDPLCAEHDPTLHGRLSGAACHACLFAAETSCERGNHYLDRALLVDTLAHTGLGFFPS